MITRTFLNVSRRVWSLVVFSTSINIRILAEEGLFLAANVGYVAGEMGTTRRLRTAGCLDIAAPIFKHQILAEMRSMLRAFLLSPSFCCRNFAGATPFALAAISQTGFHLKNYGMIDETQN